jgi:hypothetical protein
LQTRSHELAEELKPMLNLTEIRMLEANVERTAGSKRRLDEGHSIDAVQQNLSLLTL